MQNIRPRTLAGAALALTLAACGGGGSTQGSAVPVTASPSQPAGTVGGTAEARFVFTIPNPPATSSAKRAPRYISASTQSIGVTATPAGGGSAASATVNVGSSNCTTGTSGQTCTLVVAAPVGSDVFVVKMYDAPNGTGNVLSTGTMTQTVQAHVANIFPLILGGTIASLAFSIDKPNLPVVDGGSATVTVIAKDAGGNQIVGGFSTPITVSLPAGLSLTSGSTTISDSSGSQLGVHYDGVSKTALALTATSGSVTGTASIVPTSHVKYYSPAQLQPKALTFMMVKGPDGALYFGDGGVASVNGNTVSGTTPGAIARLDPATGTVTEVAIAGINPIGLLFVGNDLFIAEQNSSSVGRIAGAGNGGFSASNYAQVVLHKATPGVFPNSSNHLDAPRTLTLAGGKIYVALYQGNEIGVIDPAAWTGATTPVTYVAMSTTTQNGKFGLRPNGITTAGDGNVYITNATLTKYGYVSKLVPGSTTTSDVIDPIAGVNTAANYPEPTGLRFISAGADGGLYITWTSYNGVPNPPGLTRYDGNTTFTLLPLPGPLSTQPDSIKPGSGSTVVFNDLGLASVGVYDTSNGTFRQYPMNGFAAGPNAQYPNDVVDYGDGSYWFTNQVPNLTGAPAPQVGHLVLAAGWNVFPEGNALHIDGLGGANGLMLGIGESAASHDTFTVVSATPSICSVAQPPSYANDYVVTGVASGACSITVTDQNHRTVTVPIAVTANSVTISGTRRISQ